MSECRRYFEMYCMAAECWAKDAFETNENGSYKSFETATAWHYWQAAWYESAERLK